MEKSKIIETKKEAQRFIKKVNELGKQMESARLASIDLTRALAEMRKP